MSTRKKPEGGSDASDGLGIGPNGDLLRHQMAAYASGACALFQGFEAIRHIQMRTAHQALVQHQQALTRLQEPCTATDLFTIGVDLLRHDSQGATLYWQQLGAAALEMNRQLLASVARGARSEGEDLASSTQAYTASMSNVADLFRFNSAAAAR